MREGQYSIVVFFFFTFFLFEIKVNGYCLLNNLANTNILVEDKRKFSLTSLSKDGLPHSQEKFILTPIGKFCCAWYSSECYDDRAKPEKRTDIMSIAVACSKNNNHFTKVKFPAKGDIVVKESPAGEDNIIEVHGIPDGKKLGPKMWWYRCGTNEQINF